jgi:acyl carrier protein
MSLYILQVKEWLLAKSPDMPNFDGDFNIIENGVLDSLQFLELVYFIEDLTGQEVDKSKISVSDFMTLNKIENKFFKNNVSILEK